MALKFNYILILLFICTSISCKKKKNIDVANINTEKELIDFIDKEFKTLDIDFKTKTIVVNFWASWCNSCIVEMPELAAIADEWMFCPDINFVAITPDKKSRSSKIFNTKELFQKYNPFYEKIILMSAINKLEKKSTFEKIIFPSNAIFHRGKLIFYSTGKAKNIKERVNQTLNEILTCN